MDSWYFDVWTLNLNQTKGVCGWIIFNIARPHIAVDQQVTAAFLDECEEKYNNSNPYHNWTHAVDVVHTGFREAMLVKAFHYLPVRDIFAMLCAAVCHDVAHPGFN